VTKKWLEEASKIYRRLTSNKGEYIVLPKDMVAALRADASIVKVFDHQFKEDMKWEVKAVEIFTASSLASRTGH
jgi:hypothetical protein